MKIITNNFILKTLDLSYAIEIMEYNKRNKDFHKSSMPLKNEDFFSIESTKYSIEIENILMKQEEFYRFYVFRKNDDNIFEKIIGDVSLIDIKHNFLSSCYIGIKIDKDSINSGIGNEVLKGIIDFVKIEIKLHSIRATILPNNTISKKLFKKNGFEFDGIIKHLFLGENGWEDHFLYSLIFDN